MLHSMPRVKGTSELPQGELGAIAESIMSMQGAAFDYAAGVMAGPIALVLAFIIWAIVLCCTVCVCKSRSNGKVKLALFMALGAGSCVAFFFSMGGNSDAAAGFKDTMDATEDLLALMQGMSGAADSVGTLLTSLDAQLLIANASCSNEYVAFPYDEVHDGLTQAAESLSSSESGGLLLLSCIHSCSPPHTHTGGSGSSVANAANNIDTQFGTYKEQINSALAWNATVFWIVVVVIIVIVGLFTLSTAVRLLDPEPETGCGSASVVGCYFFLSIEYATHTSQQRFLGKLSGTVIFAWGSILLFCVYIIVIVLAALTIIGSDVCVPDVSATLNSLVASALSVNVTAGIDKADLCQDPAFNASVGGFLCWYETCEGTDPFAALAQLSAVNANASFAPIDDFLQQASELPSPYDEQAASEECTDAIQVLRDTVTNGIDSLIANVTESVACSTVNPLVARIFYTGVCGDFMGGLIVTWVALLAGASALMLAMVIHRTFNFPEAGVKPTQSANTNVASTPGKPQQNGKPDVGGEGGRLV